VASSEGFFGHGGRFFYYLFNYVRGLCQSFLGHGGRFFDYLFNYVRGFLRGFLGHDRSFFGDLDLFNGGWGCHGYRLGNWLGRVSDDNHRP
jgi:hypothetical protein